MSLREYTCSVEGCDRQARCLAEDAPVCSMHYQRFAKFGVTSLPIRKIPDYPCKTCGTLITASHGRVRAKRRGYGFCSQTCEAFHKSHSAYEDAPIRFLRRVDMKDGDECWYMRDARYNKSGYAVFDYHDLKEGRTRGHIASRFMWMVMNGPIPDNLHVCHSCDNPPCVKPGHLWLGTHQDNMDDMSRKGRGHKFATRVGEQHPMAKLTEAQVIEIRASQSGPSWLAKKYGVTPEAIKNIRIRKTWTHI